MPTAFNVWTPKGNVLPNALISGTTPILSNPNVIYDNNSIILFPGSPSTFVFKMWAMGNASAGVTYTLNYFESADGLTGWTAYSANPLLTNSLSQQYFPKVHKQGSTYYIYTGFGTIAAYTSPDGVTLTLANASAIVPGVSGWDSKQVFQLSVIDVIAGTWYGYYGGFTTGPPQSDQGFMGLATSTDGINWIKNPSNPIINVFTSNFTFQKVSSTYYGWSQVLYADPQVKAAQSLALSRFSSSSVSGPWTQLTFNGKVPMTYYPAVPGDFVGGAGNNNLSTTNGSGVADPTIVEANGNCYLYFTVTPGFNAAGVNGALASGVTLAQLVQTYEGVAGAPISGAPELNLVTLGSDSGTGANANPIGGNWTPVSTTAPNGPAQRISNTIEGVTVTTTADSRWNAVAWGNDQWSKIKFVSMTASGSMGTITRANTSNVASEYFSAFGGVALGSSGTGRIQKLVSGANTVLTSILNFTVSSGDTYLQVTNGTNTYLYYNDILIGSTTDSTFSAGASGFRLTDGGTPSNAALSTWSGGSFQNSPPINPPIPPVSVYSQPDCRIFGNFPNASRTVQSTLIYDVQTSSNPVVPSTDSRLAGAPVDSRIAAIIPENSRTPGTFGPGE